MRFFTPDLYLRFNSSDDAVVDEADAEWDAAADEYNNHLAGISNRFPPQVKTLASLCLHDAELIVDQPVKEVSNAFRFSPATEIMSFRREADIVVLFYQLWERVRKAASPGNWPFSKLRVHWLYDEVDVASAHGGMFYHRVFFSDGRTLEIPFSSVVVHVIPLAKPAGKNGAL